MDANSIDVGRFRIGPSYSGHPHHVAIHRTDDAAGEGGDFPIAALEKAIAAFYEEHF